MPGAAGALVDDEPGDFRLTRRLEDAGLADLDPALDAAVDLRDEQAVIGMIGDFGEAAQGLVRRHRIAERRRERRELGRRPAARPCRTVALTPRAPGAGARIRARAPRRPR